MIAANIIHIIRNNSGKRMVFLMGADHRNYCIKKLSETFGEEINLNGVFESK